MKKKILIITLILTLVFALAACTESDVVGKDSIRSFGALLEASGDAVTVDEENGGWSLESTSGERFIWSKDYSSGSPHDVMMEFDLEPFLAAGLDVTKLPEGMVVEDRIMVGTSLGDEELAYDGEATPLASYEQIVNLKRDQIAYHADLDHYGVSLGNGNVFEWAKDMSANDKDMVFVLDPLVFIEAGVDPEKIEGWIFAKVKVMDEDGKEMEVDKLLKPFDVI